MPVNPDVVAAFFTGVGAVLSGLLALRSARRRCERDCAERIAEVRDAIEQGYKLSHGPD